MMDDPEVTIEPADNGYIVKHYQRSTKKDENGRTIRRVASTAEEALGHAGKVLSTRTSKKKSSRDGHGMSESGAGEGAALAAHSFGGHSRGSARRRRPRVGGRRA
jgi:hypothetical protein